MDYHYVITAILFEGFRMLLLLNRIAAGLMVAGLLLVVSGGMSVHRDEQGTWVQVNVIHAAGGGSLLCGVVLAVVVAFAMGRSEPEHGVRAAGDLPGPKL